MRQSSDNINALQLYMYGHTNDHEKRRIIIIEKAREARIRSLSIRKKSIKYHVILYRSTVIGVTRF